MSSSGSVKITLLGEYKDSGYIRKAESALTGFEKNVNTAASEVSTYWATASTSADVTAAKWEAAGTRISAVGRTITTYVTLPLAAVAVAAVSTAADYETAMAKIQANSGATGDEMTQLGDLAKQMGADTVYSTEDAADAMLELSKAGMTPAEIEAGALAASMTLASAGGMGLADASDAIVSELKTYSLSAADASKVTDALAGGANASVADVSDLTQALAQCGEGATNAGLNINDTVGVLADFADNGIKGSDAGTSLKTMLQRLVPQTDDAATAMKSLGLEFSNSDGSFKSISEIAQELQDKMSGLTETERTNAMQTIFGSDATRAATVLMKEGASGLATYISATEDSTAATDMANAATSGMNGAIENMKGSVENAGIVIGEDLAPAVTAVSGTVTDLTNDFSGLDSGTQKNIIGTLALAAAIGPTVSVTGKLVTAGGDLISMYARVAAKLATATASHAANTVATEAETTASAGATTASKTEATALAATATAADVAKVSMMALGVVAVGLAIAIPYIQSLQEAQKLAADATRDMSSSLDKAYQSAKDEASASATAADAVSTYGGTISVTDDELKDLLTDQSDLNTAMTDAATSLGTNEGMLSGYKDTIDQLAGKTNLTSDEQAALQLAVQGVNDICGTSITVLDGVNGTLDTQVLAIDAVIDAYERKAKAQAAEEEYAASYKQQIEDQKELTDAIEAQKTAKENLTKAEDDYNSATNPVATQAAVTVLNNAQSTYDDTTSKVNTLSDAYNGATSDMAYWSGIMGENQKALTTGTSAMYSYINSTSSLEGDLKNAGISVGDFSKSLGDTGLSTTTLATVTSDQWAQIVSTYDGSTASLVAGLAAVGVNTDTAQSKMLDWANATPTLTGALALSGQSVSGFSQTLSDNGVSLTDLQGLTADQLTTLASNYDGTWDSISGTVALYAQQAQDAATNAAAGTASGVAASNASMVDNASSTGVAIPTSLSGGINDNADQVTNSAANLHNQVYDKSQTDLYGSGSDATNSLANGLKDGNAMAWLGKAANAVAGVVNSYLHFSEPDVGPLSDFHTYAPDMVDLLADGMTSDASLSKLSNASSLVAERVGGSLSSLRAAAVTIFPATSAGNSLASGSTTTNNRVTNIGTITIDGSKMLSADYAGLIESIQQATRMVG